MYIASYIHKIFFSHIRNKARGATISYGNWEGMGTGREFCMEAEKLGDI